MEPSIRVLVESTPKKVFVAALDWPGLARGARDEQSALDALIACLPRYAPVAAAAGHPMPAGAIVDVVERMDGDASTAFGVPGRIAEADRRPTSGDEGARLAALVEAAWAALAAAAAAREELRKGPRGGGRDRMTVVAHVTEAEAAYAAVLRRQHRPDSTAALAAMRADLLAVISEPSDGSPVAGRKWPVRYAARRIAWHVLDHAWEIEDRSGPG